MSWVVVIEGLAPNPDETEPAVQAIIEEALQKIEKLDGHLWSAEMAGEAGFKEFRIRRR